MSDFIGIRGITTGTPLSGYYINDLEGINLSLGAGLSNEDNISGVSFLQDKINLGCRLTDEDIFVYMLRLFRLNEVVGTGVVGRLPNTNTAITYNGLAAFNRGIRVKRIKTRLSQIMIKTLDIYSNTTGTETITIQDGPDTYTYSVDLVAGSHTSVDIYKEFQNEYIYITLDNSVVDTANLPILRTYYDDSCDDCACVSSSGYNNKNFTVSGWNGATFENNTFGIVANIQVICSRDEFIKTIDHLLGRVKLLRSGICILNELISSNRLNEYTLLGGEQAVLTITNWQKEYNEKMAALVERLPEHYNNIDNVCITCNSTRYSERI
jgi:hypothetical protein